MKSYRRFRPLEGRVATKPALKESLGVTEAFGLLEALEDEVLTEAAGVPGIVTIYYDSKTHKLRAQADDGEHGPANVAFPNELRTEEGVQYQVDSLIWNGKNYRAAGEITPIDPDADEEIGEIVEDEAEVEDDETEKATDWDALGWDGMVEMADDLLDELTVATDNYEHDDRDGYWCGSHVWCNRYLYYSNTFNNEEELERLCDEYSARIPDCSFYFYLDTDTEEDPVSEIGYRLGKDEYED
jgi:hypothetical protein